MTRTNNPAKAISINTIYFFFFLSPRLYELSLVLRLNSPPPIFTPRPPSAPSAPLLPPRYECVGGGGCSSQSVTVAPLPPCWSYATFPPAHPLPTYPPTHPLVPLGPHTSPPPVLFFPRRRLSHQGRDYVLCVTCAEQCGERLNG